MEQKFRNATFGGFNRQDVLNYLEASAKETSTQLQSAQHELQSAVDESERLRDELEVASVAKKTAQGEFAILAEQVSQFEQTIARMRADMETQANTILTLHMELGTSTEELNRIKPDAITYATIKDRTAGVELDAHRRAEQVKIDAKTQALAFQKTIEMWAIEMRKEYTDLRSHTEATVIAANNQLSQVSGVLATVTKGLLQQDERMEQFIKNYAHSDETSDEQ